MNTRSNAEPIEVSAFRLHLLRAMYLLLVVGLSLMIWPGIVNHPLDVPHMNGVVRAMLGAVALLAVVGIRYPLRMLPLLFFELVWKSIWILAFGLPLILADQLDPNTRETLFDCVTGVVLVAIVVPWRYVLASYIKQSGDRWGRQETSRVSLTPASP